MFKSLTASAEANSTADTNDVSGMHVRTVAFLPKVKAREGAASVTDLAVVRIPEQVTMRLRTDVDAGATNVTFASSSSQTRCTTTGLGDPASR